ncbi:protein G12-like [Lutzomyia longipalpis]|uniref:protein G12-like n=1 Tax=Lutzomyia longipalpis TaxID=7200 RepID=UPI0024846E82|nr:protein G12-like [Lutzomyia longipalpis]
MKTIFAIFCLVCSVVAQSGDSESFYTVDPFNTPELNQDFADFVNLLPVDTVLDIVDDHYENNAGINKTLNYLKTNKFAKHWDNLFSLREVHNFVVYLNESGLNIFGVLNEFAEYFELTPVGFVFVEDAPEEKIEYTWGFNALVNDVIDVLPKDDLKALFDQKVANGEDFANFVECFSTSEFKEVLKKLELSPVAQKLFKRFRKHGLDVHKLVQLALAVFGLN